MVVLCHLFLANNQEQVDCEGSSESSRVLCEHLRALFFVQPDRGRPALHPATSTIHQVSVLRHGCKEVQPCTQTRPGHDGHREWEDNSPGLALFQCLQGTWGIRSSRAEPSMHAAAHIKDTQPEKWLRVPQLWTFINHHKQAMNKLHWMLVLPPRPALKILLNSNVFSCLVN